MSKIKRITALVCLLALSASAWASSGYIYDASGSVSLVVGKGEPRWAKINDTVSSGTVIRTGKASHAVLKFEDGQVVSLQANTTFQVRNYIYAPRHPQDSSILFSMFKGGMRFVTGMIGKDNPDAFRLATPNATIGIRGTDFMAVLASNGNMSTQVISGSIGVTNAAGTTVLAAGQTALTSSATALTATVPASSVPAGTFSQINSIALPPATPAPVPAPPAAGAGAPLSGAAPTTAASGSASAATAGTTATTTAATGTTAGTATTAAGGAAAGGAGIAAVATAGAGISATTIAIGVAAAAGVAAVVNATSTTSH